MLLITLILSIIFGTLISLYQWCQFRPTEGNFPTTDHATFNPHFNDFLAGRTTCQIWAFNFTMPQSFNDFTAGFSSNVGALGNEWYNNEGFRFILVAYINIFILVLVYAYVFLKNLNQYMEGRRKARITSNIKKKRNQQVVWNKNTPLATGADRRTHGWPIPMGCVQNPTTMMLRCFPPQNPYKH